MTDLEINIALDELSTALTHVKDKKLVQEFLKCILTTSEIGEVTSRWTLVRRIKDGQTQRGIAKDLGLSLCKITRGSKELKKDDSAFGEMIDIYENHLTKQ
ncbi:MAG: hypothetical protein B6229_00180 [Spirochaetaceae bacterium 4572_7]|nr:MAG: hypothetical protein B6229_00180 [Spirochaetaceae bacterium 4572_7]